MIPTLLITLREVIEASLVVATILGILTKLNQKESVKTVWVATASALLVSFLLVFGGSTMGIHIQKLYEGNYEPVIEGTLYTISAFFVTWAVFVLHKHFSRKKMHMLQHVKETIAHNQRRGIFMLTFTAVLREGIEIVLFLSTMYLTATQPAILGGFALGIVGGLVVSGVLFFGTVRMPVYYAFRATSFLLILFAGGLLARGIGEFVEFIPMAVLPTLTFGFLPDATSLAGAIIQTLFGVTRTMHATAAVSYVLYIFLMHRRVFVRSRYSTPGPEELKPGFLRGRGSRC